MSTHRVRPGGTIAELLQALSTNPAKPKHAAVSQKAVVASGQAGARDPAALQRELAAMAANVDLESEPAVRALRRPMVRRVLLWEFGEAFLEHPDFQSALAAIETAMDADPAVPGQFRALLGHLRQL